jgi:prolyl oligopeptidase
MLQRREFLAGTGSIAMLSFLPRQARARSAHLPPIARTVDVVDRRFGLILPDPYRWMENAKDPDWEPFMRGQAAYARAQLDAVPRRGQVGRRIAEISGDSPLVSKIQRVGGKAFVEYRPAGAVSFKLYVIDRPDAARRLLYDPEQESDGSGMHRSVDFWVASPDGNYLAFGSSQAGSEDSVLRVLKTLDGSSLPEQLDRAQYARVAWLPDSSGFFVSRLRDGSERGETSYYDNSVVWLHPLRGDPKNDLRIVGGGDIVDGYRIPASDFPAVMTDPGSQWILLHSSGAVRRYNPIFAARLSDLRTGAPRWRSILTLADEVTNSALRGDHLYYVSERAAPNGRVLKKDLTAPVTTDARLIAPESEFPIEPKTHGTLMVAARDGVYFVRTKGGPQVVYRLDDDDSFTALPMPFEAGVHDLFASTQEDGLDAGMAGWVQPFGIWRYTANLGRFADARLSPRADLDLRQYESFQIMAVARDGTRVPVSIIARRGLKRDGSAPCLARCYSAYGISATPGFNPRLMALLERGGVFAQVHARGGGEYGSHWWKAGQKETKPNTWRDLIDGCQALFDVGLTAPKRLTILGGSAGGIAIGRALTERPDMFAGAILNVAFTNPSRSEVEPAGAAHYDEFGNPGIEAEFKAIHEMDTYQHVRDGSRYPAVLIMHGMTDPRVSPWHSAKLAARLQKANASDTPTLLRVTFDAGHGVGSTRTQIDEQWADMIAFTLWRATTSHER